VLSLGAGTYTDRQCAGLGDPAALPRLGTDGRALALVVGGGGGRGGRWCPFLGLRGEPGKKHSGWMDGWMGWTRRSRPLLLPHESGDCSMARPAVCRIANRITEAPGSTRLNQTQGRAGTDWHWHGLGSRLVRLRQGRESVMQWWCIQSASLHHDSLAATNNNPRAVYSIDAAGMAWAWHVSGPG
jgi:hypothetical protein